MADKYFTALYITAEDAVTAFRKKCEVCNDLETLKTAQYELDTLRMYIDIALAEIAIELDRQGGDK